MSLTLTTSPLKEFGRGGMTELSPYSKNYTPTRPNYPYQVTDRTQTGDYFSVETIVPFPITLTSPDGSSSCKAYAVIHSGYIYFYPVGKNMNYYAFNNIYESSTSSRIFGWGSTKYMYTYSIRLPLAYTNVTQNKDDYREYTYCSPDNDFFIYRLESRYSDSYVSVAEIWVTADGHIQMFQNSPSHSYSRTLSSTKSEDYVLTDTPITCTSGDCPYRVAVTGRETIRFSNTATESGTVTITVNWGDTDQTQTVSVTAGDTAETVATKVKALSWSRCTTTLTSDDDYFYVIFNASSSGYFNVDCTETDTNGASGISGLSCGWFTGYSDEDETVYYINGTNAILCSYYSTSRASCYYGAYKSEYVSSTYVSSYTISSTNVKALRMLTRLYSDGSLEEPNYNSHYSYTRTGDTYGFSGSIEVHKGSYKNTEFLNLYSKNSRSEYKPLIVRVNGANVRANLMPIGNTPVGNDVKVEALRLKYGDDIYCGVNLAESSKNSFRPPIIVDKTLNYLYVNNSSYRWEYTDVYGFSPILTNVEKVRVLWYTQSVNGSYTAMPNNSYPQLYFSYKSAYDNSGSSWSSAYNSSGGVVTLSSSETGDVQNRPHLVEFTFSSPTNIAQWIISPRSLNGNYTLPNMNNCIFAINFITSDGKSVKFL